MSVDIKPAGRIAIIVFVLAVLFGTAKFTGLLDKVFKKSIVVDKVDLPTATINATTTGLKFAGVPSDKPSTKTMNQETVEIPKWNAILGAEFANGGPITTEGSICERNGIRVILKNQDDDGKSEEALIKFANDYHDSKDVSSDTHFFIDMGDGGPAIIAALNKELKKLGPDYTAKVIGAVGKSGNAISGEDGFWAPATWRAQPDLAKGGLIYAQKLNGDWNIMVQWCHDHNINFNPDERTWNAHSLNYVNAPTFQAAGELYIANGDNKRAIVDDNGKAIGKDTIIKGNGYCSWTPVDVNVAEKRGGVVKLISTKEYSNQMFAVVIGINKYCVDHADNVQKMLASFLQGGDQVKSYSAALNKAGDIAAKIYNDHDGAYWVKYAKGVSTTDKQGLNVDLGGSTQFNLGDALFGFGITPGSSNIYSTVYTNFKDAIDLKFYPEMFKETPMADANDAMDLTYLKAIQNQVQSTGGTISAASTTAYSKSGEIDQVSAKRSYAIQFQTGKADLLPAGIETLKDVNASLTNAGSQRIKLIGYTDNTGSEPVNEALSLARAQAVKTYLQATYGSAYPEDRFVAPQGLGSQNPIGDNALKSGQAKNRRVEIIIGE